MRILSALFGFFICLVSLTFALSNRQSVTISLWPFDMEITAPLFVMTLGLLAAGLLVGGFWVWLTVLPHRFLARRLNKDVTLLSGKILELERELDRHRAQKAPSETPLLTGSKWRFWERL